MKRNISITLITLAIISLLITACQPANNGGGAPEAAVQASPVPAQATQQPPTEAAPQVSMVIDPSTSSSPADAYVYEGLAKLQDGQPTLVLALQTTMSDDGLDYIIQLLPGITFHDGTDLNAEAVIANFTRWFDPQSPLRGDGTFDTWVKDFGGFKGELTADGKPKSEFDGIEKVDDRTVLVHLNTPDNDFLTKLADPAFSIISPSALAAPGFGTPSGVDGGTGPYKIGSWNTDSVTLEPFANYWDTNAIPTSSMDIPYK